MIILHSRRIKILRNEKNGRKKNVRSQPCDLFNSVRVAEF